MNLENDILKELKKNNKLKIIDIVLKIVLIVTIIFSMFFMNSKFKPIVETMNKLDVEGINNKINELDIESINENLNNLKIITNDMSSIVERLDLSSKVDSSMDTIDNIVDKGTEIFNGIKDNFSKDEESKETEPTIDEEETKEEDLNKENSNFFDSIKEGISDKINGLTGNGN